MNAQQLKNAILQEAIEGRLVPQDPNDEPASALLARIRKEKEQLVKAGKLKKKDLVVNPISEDEIPFEIPESWEWVKITSILLLLTDGTHNSPPSYPSGDYLYITAKNIKTEGIDLTNVSYVSQKVHDEIFSRCNPEYGDILYIKDGATAGVVTINNLKEPFSLLSSVALLKQSREMDSRYLLAYFNSPYCYNTVRSSMKGAAITRITLRMIQEWLIPVPPIEEQRRIASKVDSLLPKIKEYGKAQDALNKLNAELPERLKKSILQEAIEGCLVPQDPNDEPASVLLTKIRQEKEQLVKEGKLKKKDLVVNPISEDEIPFDIPDSWEWVRIGDYANKVTDFVASGSFATLRENVKYYSDKEYAILVRTKDFQTNFQTDLVYTDKHGYDFLSNSNLRGGELILPNIGASIGKVFIVPKLDYPMTLAPNTVMIRFYWEDQRDWIYTLFCSTFGKALLNEISSSTAQGKFNKTDFKKLVIPLPPLAEQKRIVAKIEEVFAEIDKMKK